MIDERPRGPGRRGLRGEPKPWSTRAISTRRSLFSNSSATGPASPAEGRDHGRITEIREAQSYNRFVERYNQAVDLANQGDVQGALAILGPLIETTQDPTQVERARTLVQRLKGPEKKRSGSKPR